MARGYVFTHPTLNDAVGGDPATGTLWGETFETSRLALYNTILAAVDADVDFLFDQVDAESVDNLVYTFKDTSTITVQAGVAAADDDTAVYTVTSATDVDCSSLGNDKMAFVWIGEDSISAQTELEVNDDPDTPPTNLLHSHRLRWFFETDGSGNVVQFAPPKSNIDRGITAEYAGTYRPLNCVFCDGAAYGRTHTLFSDLFDEIGTTWGVGDGSTTFNIPDHRGRASIGVGQGSGLTNRTLAGTMGEEDHALTTLENATHSHSMNFSAVGQSGGAYNVLDGGGSPQPTTSSGAGNAHNTMQPSIVVTKIIAY